MALLTLILLYRHRFKQSRSLRVRGSEEEIVRIRQQVTVSRAFIRSGSASNVRQATITDLFPSIRWPQVTLEEV